jgi:enoyl-CoA hydratase/carnithine racemase
VDPQTLVSRLDGGVLTLRLDRPEARNALTDEMIEALHEALEQAARDDTAAAVVITGTGKAFCAGADLSRFEEPTDARRCRFESHRLTELVGLIERIEKPVVAAVNGVAVGIGVQLALACAIAAETIGQSLLIGTDDHSEGRQALRERRQPRFQGR